MKDVRLIDVPGDDESWYKAVTKSYGLNISTHKTNSGQLWFSQTRSLSMSNYMSAAPFLTDGGSLKRPVNDDDVKSIRELVIKRQCRFALIKSRFPPELVNENAFVQHEYLTMTLSLEGGEEKILKSRVDGKTRNQLRKAQKNNFRVIVGREELLRDAYGVLTKCWRDLGTPSHSYEMFQSILAEFGPDKCSVHVIYSGTKPVSAAVVFITRDSIHHPWAGTIQEFKSTSVNNLLYWSIIQEGCQQRLEYFDMGRSSVGKGTYAFKKSWGTEDVPLYYIYVGANPSFKFSDSQMAHQMTKVWKWIPLPIANLVGPTLIKTVL